MVKTRPFQIRLEQVIFDGLNDASQPSKRGKSGGVGLLFKRLACLFLNIKLPPQYGRADLTERYKLEELEEDVQRLENFPLSDLEESDFYHQRKDLLDVLASERDPFERFRAFHLLGRITLLEERFRRMEEL